VEFFVIVFVLAMCAAYVLPTFIAFRRQHPNRWPILLINVVFGATVLGWVAALIWALHAVHRPDVSDASSGGESGLNIFVNDPKAIRINDAKRVESQPRTLQAAMNEIDRLKKLRAESSITDTEFEILKALVLQRNC
jgi:hypothetical protein